MRLLFSSGSFFAIAPARRRTKCTTSTPSRRHGAPFFARLFCVDLITPSSSSFSDSRNKSCADALNRVRRAAAGDHRRRRAQPQILLAAAILASAPAPLPCVSASADAGNHGIKAFRKIAQHFLRGRAHCTSIFAGLSNCWRHPCTSVAATNCFARSIEPGMPFSRGRQLESAP